MATWFADIVLAELPAPGSSTLRITNADYAAGYFPFDTYKRLQIELEDGSYVWRKVLTATPNPDGTTTLQLDVGFGGDPADVAVTKISFLNRVRLTSDSITLTHERLRTQIELPTRTVDL